MRQSVGEFSPEVVDFAGRISNYEAAAEAIRQCIVARLRDDGLNHHDVRCRVKTPTSVQEKLDRRDDLGNPRYPGGPENLDDLVGVRVILFVETDIKAVAIALTNQFICHDDEDKTAVIRKNGGIGYAGRHLTLEVPVDNPPVGCEAYRGQRFEVQLRTVLQHAWAEFEHDIRFKGTHVDNAEISRAFTMASTLIELADQQFVNIADILKRMQSESAATESQELDANNVQLLLDRVFPAYPHSKAGQYRWLVEVFGANGFSTVAAVEQWFMDIDQRAMVSGLGYRFLPGQVRVVDDLLLKTLGEPYIEATKNVGNDFNREGKLRFRLRRFRTLQH
ncbi:GTP pyrophosphokinase family protein [Arthrobacter sp. SDTb3-6]|uniref:GTP pyrophosphokinase n=1 Tax=Arthrobacter sp. SDTb3-6 TaxID=2713571 RepID=UPI00159E36E9|nr:GTP pyrophosphokinase family protein [Arthrobacter sp. SDTb3-6]NVM97057.1 GTP pyrophosphokinase family protein [Arthrobacter sp. SDTb3-6]